MKTPVFFAAVCAAAAFSGPAAAQIAPASGLDYGVYVPGGRPLLQQADFFFAYGGRHYC